MEQLQILKSILNSIPYPIVFVDLSHTIRYLNKKAEYRYYKERGYDDLIGKSIFDCHSEKSSEFIRRTIENFKKHGQEVYLTVNVKNERVYIVPVRDDLGNLIGYYERFEMNLQK